MLNMARRILSTVFLIVPTCAQMSAMNDLLIADGKLIGAGVLTRLTPLGSTYVTRTVALALAPDIADAAMPFKARSATFPSLPTVRVIAMQIRHFHMPEDFEVVTTPPNLVTVSIPNANISVSAIGFGEVDGVTLSGPLEIRSHRLRLNVTVQVTRSSRGNPGLKDMATVQNIASHVAMLHDRRCTVHSEAGNLCRRMKLQTRCFDRASRSAETYQAARSNRRVCSFIRLQRFLLNGLYAEWPCLEKQRYITSPPDADDQIATCRVAANIPVTIAVGRAMTLESGVKFAINQRFSLLASRIALGDVQNFDLVKSVIASQQDDGILRRLHGATIRKRTMALRVPRQSGKVLLNSFNLSRADSLFLDYGMLELPSMSGRGIELVTSGEITAFGPKTPFGPRRLELPEKVSADFLQMAISDFVPNSLMYHGHRIGLFNTRVDSFTPQIGPLMRTTCDFSTETLFCIGDLFPTLRDSFPNRAVVFKFSTSKAPAVIVRPRELGGIRFQMLGLIEVGLIARNGDEPIGNMEIRVDASMLMRMTPRVVRVKVNLDDIKLETAAAQCTLANHSHLTRLSLTIGRTLCYSKSLKSLPISASRVSLVSLQSRRGRLEFPLPSHLSPSSLANSARAISSPSIGRQADSYVMVSRSPRTLVQEELDDASFLSREVLQRMVNDILKQGIPIPVHPLFRLQNPKLSLEDRAMLLETNFQLNGHLIRQLISKDLL